MDGYVSDIGFMVGSAVLAGIFKTRLDDYLSKLKVKAVSKVGHPKPFKLYREVTFAGRSHYILPRGCVDGFRASKLLNVVDLLPPKPRVDYEFEGELYQNQVVVRDHLMTKYFAGDYGQCTLNMGAGLGKTATAAGMITALKTRVLYVTKDRFLQKQAYGDLKGFFPRAKICKFENKKYDPTAQYDIVVIVINSALMQKRPFFTQFGLAIVDEIHAFCKRKRSELFWLLQMRYLLGMSATTNDRSDQLDAVYHRHFGDVVHAASLPGFDIAGAEFQGKVKAIRYAGPEKYAQDIYSEQTGMLFTPAMISLLTQDPARNRLVVDEIIKLWRKPSRYIYVFSEYREHLTTLASMLKERIGVDAVMEDDVNTMMGGIKDDALERAVKSRIILTTYGFGSTGISIKHMNACVFATPRRNGYKQTCARAMRRGSDLTIVRKFIDIVDSKSALKYQFCGRKQAYDYYGFTIKTVTYRPLGA